MAESVLGAEFAGTSSESEMLIRLSDLPFEAARRSPGAIALRESAQPPGVQAPREADYSTLTARIVSTAHAFAESGLRRGDRVAVIAEKRLESVVAMFAAAAIGAIFVPLNPVLRREQIEHILRDSGARLMVGPQARLAAFNGLIACAPWDGADDPLAWRAAEPPVGLPGPEPIEADAAAILYTSGSTGLPKGVVLSHRNLVAGAQSVAGYLGNDGTDRLLAALPLSFDAGFSQLTTGFLSGATVVLHNYLLPQDCLRVMARERITGLTAVPPLWIQLAEREWPVEAAASLRYFANTGGAMPRPVLARLRSLAPNAAPVLMYGLTEAFRSTWLPPEEVDRRPGSIGKAIPGAEILVLRPDGSECGPGEPGELVHRGPTVTLGYWDDPARTAERFRPAPGRPAEIPAAELAVWSGDIVERDAEGFLYFIGRRDEQIKTSGYRVSPTEVEQVLQACSGVIECVVFGVPDERLGQAIVAVLHCSNAGNGEAIEPGANPAPIERRIQDELRNALPAYMLPRTIVVEPGPLPRGANGKLDRRAIAAGYAARSTCVNGVAS